MAKQHYWLDSRVLTAFFLAAMPFVAFGSFVVVNMARGQLREAAAASLEQRAVQTKLEIEQYLSDQAAHLRVLAGSPEVQAALNAPPAALPPADQARTLEQDWLAGRNSSAASVLTSPLADRLHAIAAVRPSLVQLHVVDASGRVLAAVRRAGRLFHGDSAWFQELAQAPGRPRLLVGELQRPRGSTATLLEIAYPVQRDDGTFAGALRAVLDANDLYTVIAPVRVGRTGHAVLLRAQDGMVLAADESERVLKTVYPGFTSLSSAIEGFPIAESGQALFGRASVRRGSWTIPEVRALAAQPAAAAEPARLVGFSPVDQFPGASWLVVVEQDLAEALAPIDGVTRYLWIHFIGVFATVILLALYFSFKLERPVMEEGLHLHEEHMPAGMGHAA